jgi:hypothetical protein
MDLLSFSINLHDCPGGIYRDRLVTRDKLFLVSISFDMDGSKTN